LENSKGANRFYIRSASAWPIMKKGVSVAIMVDDNEVETSMLKLQEYGVNAGPCGAATTAALKKIPGLTPDSVVVVLCTEAARRYDMKGSH